MPLQGLMLILFMIIIVPSLIIFANHEIFFILISIILFYTSLRNIYKKITNFNSLSSETNDEISDEFEQISNVNVKKFKDGISVSKNLIIILFFIYCSFIVSSFLIKILIALILTFRLISVINSFRSKIVETSHSLIINLKTTFSLLIDFLTTAIIIFISIKKY